QPSCFDTWPKAIAGKSNTPMAVHASQFFDRGAASLVRAKTRAKRRRIAKVSLVVGGLERVRASGEGSGGGRSCISRRVARDFPGRCGSESSSLSKLLFSKSAQSKCCFGGCNPY